MRNWGFRRYNAMLDHWELNGPPVYISVAGYLGLIKDKKKKTKVKDPEGKDLNDRTAPKGDDLNDLVKMFASTGGVIQ